MSADDLAAMADQVDAADVDSDVASAVQKERRLLSLLKALDLVRQTLQAMRERSAGGSPVA